MNKFKLYTFVTCASICALLWIVIFMYGLFSINDLGLIGFIVLIGVVAFLLCIPLSLLALVTGINKIAVK